jgi:hypothetical protein
MAVKPVWKNKKKKKKKKKTWKKQRKRRSKRGVRVEGQRRQEKQVIKLGIKTLC